jgi:carbonic anhydrase
LPSDGYD